MRRDLQRELRLQRRHLSSLLAESRRKRRYGKWSRLPHPGPSSCPYSPECVEGEFCELRNDGVLRSSPPDTAATLARPDSVQAIVHRSGETLPVLSLGRLDLCSVEVCASFGVAHYRAGKLPQGYLADTDSSTHRPYCRLCAAALGNRFWAWVANLLGCLGIGLLGTYLVTDYAVVRPANSSVGLRPANTTSPAPFHTALVNCASIAGTVLG